MALAGNTWSAAPAAWIEFHPKWTDDGAGVGPAGVPVHTEPFGIEIGATGGTGAEDEVQGPRPSDWKNTFQKISKIK